MIYALVMLGVVYVSAIAAYQYLERWGWEDAVYFTTATITTIGYGDIVPKTYFGKMITVPLMLVGIAIGFYFIYTLQEYGRSKVEHRIDTTIEHMDRMRKRNAKNAPARKKTR